MDNPPAHGVATALGDGTFQYVHDGSEGPDDTFTYDLRNVAGLGVGSVLVTIAVLPTNDAPTAANDGATPVDGGLVNIAVSGNDLDADDGLDLGSVLVVTPPAHGTVTVVGDGSVDYQHDGQGVLEDSFTYTIADLAGVVSNVATVRFADAVCDGHPQWMPVSCVTTDWVWSRNRNLATDVATVASLQILATGCYHAYGQPAVGDGLCSLDGMGWVSVDQFPMTNCDTLWFHLGGAYTGPCGGHDSSAPFDFYRHLVIDPVGCYDY